MILTSDREKCDHLQHLSNFIAGNIRAVKSDTVKNDFNRNLVNMYLDVNSAHHRHHHRTNMIGRPLLMLSGAVQLHVLHV